MTDASPPAATPPEGRRRSRRVLPMVLVGVAVLLVAVLSAGVFYAVSIDRSLSSNLNRSDTLPGDSPSRPGEPARPSADPATKGALNYVLLGSDSRDPGNEGNGRSDSILVAHLNRDRTKAYLISFPRDMWVPIPGYGRNKINAAYAFGGPKLTVRTLEGLLDTRMDHVVLIDFAGFIQLTEDLGGVTVPNQTAFRSHGFSYPKGQITISGEEALWFVRERKQLPGGDFDRAENQRNVIKAILAKALSPAVVGNPARFSRFVGGLAKHLTVDSSLSNQEIQSTALSLRLTGSDIVSLQAPVSGVDTSTDGQSIDVVDEKRMAELARALRTDTVDDYAKKYRER